MQLTDQEGQRLVQIMLAMRPDWIPNKPGRLLHAANQGDGFAYAQDYGHVIRAHAHYATHTGPGGRHHYRPPDLYPAALLLEGRQDAAGKTDAGHDDASEECQPHADGGRPSGREDQGDQHADDEHDDAAREHEAGAGLVGGSPSGCHAVSVTQGTSRCTS